MSESSSFSIGADGIDTQAIVEEIRLKVEAKVKSGEYNDARITRAEKSTLMHMKNNQEFLDYYLQCISRASLVDIREFEIPKAPGLKGKIKHTIQKITWSMLKFYTYRMWTQQNQINGMMNTAVGLIRAKNEEAITDHKKRIRALEKALETAGITLPDVQDEDEEGSES